MTNRGSRGRKASAKTFRANGAAHVHFESERGRVNGAARSPCYDGEHGELRVGDVVVKRITQKSDAQAVLLSTFEEEGWPETIDDPLPGKEGQDAPQRLRTAVANLNRRQRKLLLHFRVTGQGTRVSWEFGKKKTRRAKKKPRQ